MIPAAFGKPGKGAIPKYRGPAMRFSAGDQDETTEIKPVNVGEAAENGGKKIRFATCAIRFVL